MRVQCLQKNATLNAKFSQRGHCSFHDGGHICSSPNLICNLLIGATMTRKALLIRIHKYLARNFGTFLKFFASTVLSDVIGIISE